MATTIKLKNGSGAPLAGDLVAGEPALDLTNKRLYTEDTGGTVIEVGTNPTSLTTGTFTSTGIDDNATSTAITIDSSQNVTVGGTTAGNAGSVNLSVGSPGSTAGGLQLWAGTSGSHFMQFGDVASGDGYYRGAIGYLHASDSLVAYSAGAERMRIDSSGNVGIGLTPNTWSTGKAVELGFEGNALWGNAADEIIVSQNAYYNSGWKYATTRAASHYSQYNGAHRWFTAASGTADSALTWTQAMTLDANGSVKVTNSAGSTIIANRTSNPGSVELQYNGTQTAQFSALSGGGVATFVGSTPSESMRIDASGNLLVGKTSTSFTVAGVRVRGDTVGIIEATSANNMLVLNRLTSDGDMATFYKDGTTVGSIGSH